MNKIISKAVLSVALALPIVGFGADYYVATNGNDSSIGDAAHPFRTIQKAVDSMAAGDVCRVGGGHYRESVVLDGAEGTLSAPYRIEAIAGEQVVMDGTLEITNQWSAYSGEIYRTEISQDIWELFLDGEMMIPARWPNADPKVDFWALTNSIHWAEGNPYDTNGICNDIPHDGIDLSDLNFSVSNALAIMNFGSFRTWAGRVTSHAPNSGSFEYEDIPISFREKEHYYYLERKLELLDAEKEWFYDQGSGYLYLWAPGGGVPSGVVKGKNQSYAFSIDNSSYVQLKNIDFFGTTFQIHNSDHVTVSDSDLQYPSCTKRMLGDTGEPDTTLINPSTSYSYCTLRRSTFAYTDGAALYASGTSNIVEDCYFHHIDYSCAGLPNLQVSIYIKGKANTFRRNTVHTTGASSVLDPGEALDPSDPATGVRIEYNDMSKTGCLQSDGAMAHCMVGQQPQMDIHHNWLHDTPKMTARFDGSPGGIDGTMRQNVSWNGKGLLPKGDYHMIYNNTGFDHYERNDIMILSDPVFGGSANTITRNNAAETISGTRTGESPVPGHYDHNWNGYEEADPDIRKLLRDPDNLDFRPRKNSVLVDAGTNVVGVTEGYLGSAPDLGAYESGATNYWIAGRRVAAASLPVPPDGSETVKPFADLMWQPGLDSTGHRIYLAADSNLVANATTNSLAYRGEQPNNIFDPGALRQQTYFWRVDELTPTGTVAGAVWSFAPDSSLNPPVLANRTVSNLNSRSALIGGEVLSAGAATPAVQIHWWQEGGLKQELELGLQTGVFQSTLSNLTPQSSYYYICSATNSDGAGWAATTNYFMTPEEFVDSDSDGINDAWEIDYFGSLGVADSVSDWDSDGFRDLEEYLALTDPTDASSFFRVTLAPDQGNNIMMEFQSKSGRIYGIDWTESLSDPEWIQLSANISGDGTLKHLSDELLGGSSSGYASAVMDLNPVAYWKLDEAAGASQVYDEISGTYMGVLDTNNAVSATLDFGVNGLIDDVSSSVDFYKAFIDLGNPAEYQLDAFTIAFWMWNEDAAGSYISKGMAMVDPASEAPRRANWDIYTSTNGLLVFNGMRDDLSGWNWEISAADPAAGPHFIVACWDGTTESGGVKLYIDGELASSGEALSTTLENGKSLALGGARPNTTPGRTLDGKLDDVSLFDYPLDSSQVETLWKSSQEILKRFYRVDVWR